MLGVFSWFGDEMVVDESCFCRNGGGGEEPAYGLVGRLDVGAHVGRGAQHGVAAR